jgi:hypothetical protein
MLGARWRGRSGMWSAPAATWPHVANLIEQHYGIEKVPAWMMEARKRKAAAVK